MEKNNLTIVVVDDHLIFCESLKLIIETEHKYKVIGLFQNGIQLLKFLEHTICDFILMDIEMKEMGGVEATKKITKKYPEINIIAISMYEDKYSMIEMLQAGAKGYLIKSMSSSLLFEAINVISNGQFYFSKEIIERRNENIKLSKDELGILKFASSGLKNEEISRKLTKGIRTIEKLKSKMIVRFGAKNLSNLLIIAMKKKWIKILIFFLDFF